MLLRTEASERLLEQGHRQLMDFRLEAAEQTFRQLAERPDGVAGEHYLALSALFKGMVTDNEEHFETFFDRSDALRERLDEEPESPWRDHLLAEANLQRALAAGKMGRYIRAALAARSAYSGCQRVLEENPELHDAYMDMGLLHLTVGTLPGGWRRLLRFLGFSGEALEGFHELQQAAEQGRYNREQARVLVALTQIVIFQEPELGLEHLASLHEAYPESLLYTYLYGFGLFTNRRAEEAEKILRSAVRHHDSSEYFFINYIEFYLAEVLFAQEEFAAAETYYRRYLARHQGLALKALAYLSLGLALEMQGERDEALHYYRRVETSRDFDSDQAARRAASRRVERPLSARERTLLKGRNAYDAGHYDRALALLVEILEDPEAAPEERAEAAYRRGRVLHAQGELEAALQAYRYAVSNPGDPQAKWGPWSQFYIGKIYEEQQQEEQAAQAYEAALAYDENFDYRQSLEQATRIALEEVGREN